MSDTYNRVAALADYMETIVGYAKDALDVDGGLDALTVSAGKVTMVLSFDVGITRTARASVVKSLFPEGSDE